MGHTDIKTTMNVYAYVTDKKQEETGNRFAQFMTNQVKIISQQETQHAQKKRCPQ